jgi:hypothetical protein
VVNRLEAACRGVDWSYSPRLRCLGFDWSILSNDSQLVDHVTRLYEPCIDGDGSSAAHRFILRRHGSPEFDSVSLYRDGGNILRRVSAGSVFARLVWEVNRGVVEQPERRLLIHAAAAERDGNVVLLAGPEGAGKSTLVTGLVRSGLRYVTDETVAVDVSDGTIEPYPKPIALDRASPRSLLDLDGALPPGLETTFDQRLVPARAIRGDAVAPRGGRPRLLILPAYRPELATEARPIPRAEAAIALAEQSFNFRHLGPGRLDVVAEVVRACDCYRLDVGDLDEACRLVHELFERAVATR